MINFRCGSACCVQSRLYGSVTEFGLTDMDKIALSKGVFLRHVGDETAIWCPRSAGCLVLRNACHVISQLLQNESVGASVHSLAEEFGCDEIEVRNDIEALVRELLRQGFLTCTDGNMSDTCFRDNVAESALTEVDHDEDESPLADFYSRHGLPGELHIDLTDGCNERCVHCYLPKGEANFIDTNVARKVLKEFRDAQGLTVFISGGECMLHKDFAVILRYAKSLDLNIIVLSNLTLCDSTTVELLKEIDPQFVNVSLYAVNETVHDSITQVQGSCRKTKDAINALQAAGVHVRIATPFMCENRKCVDELRERVHLIADCEIFGQTDHSCANQSHALSMAELADLVSQNKDIFARGCYKPAECASDAKVCDIGDLRLNLDAEGRYYPCDGFHGAIIGDARKDSLWDVWTGEPLNKLRRLKNKDFGACVSCTDRAWCKVCPMRNFNETGSMFTHAAWRCEAAKLYRRIYEEK